MKKILLVAALLAATIGASAQSSDTIVSLHDLAATNMHLQQYERAVGTSVAMVGIGTSIACLGIYTLTNNGQFDISENRRKAARMAIVGGALLSVASIIPVSVKGIHLDSRGLVVDIPDSSRKGKRK